MANKKKGTPKAKPVAEKKTGRRQLTVKEIKAECTTPKAYGCILKGKAAVALRTLAQDNGVSLRAAMRTAVDVLLESAASGADLDFTDPDG